MNLGLINKDIEFLKELQQELLTQDHVGQMAPRFWVVRGTVREYGFGTGWADGEAIIVDCETALDTMKEAYEYLLEHHSHIPYKYNENDTLGYYDGEEWVTLCDMQEVCDFLQEHGEDEAYVVGYKDIQKNFENTFFLTSRECEKHIRINHYHYPKDSCAYAMTAWRAPQVSKLWDILERINLSELDASEPEEEN